MHSRAKGKLESERMDLMLEVHFLTKDREQSLKELECIAYCMARMTHFFEIGNFKNARLYAENILRSTKELEKMSQAKKRRDEDVNDLIHELQDLGVNVVLLKKSV